VLQIALVMLHVVMLKQTEQSIPVGVIALEDLN
jgi:hypothetical protein